MAQLGAGTGTSYPASLDTRQTWVNAAGAAPDSASRLDAEMMNDFAVAILRLQEVGGLSPAGTFPDIATRLNQYLPGTGVLPTGYLLMPDAIGQLSYSPHVFWNSTSRYFGINTATPGAPLEVRNIGPNNAFNPCVRLGDQTATIIGNIGIRHVSANNRQGLKIHSAVSLTLHAATQSIYFQTGNITDETSDVNTCLTIQPNGSVLVGSPGVLTGQGFGTINAYAVYDEGVILTSYPLAYVRDRHLDLTYWDRLVPTGHHVPARQFLTRADRDIDLASYMRYWRSHGHLPSLPNPAILTAGQRPSLGQLAQALWETVDLHAIHIAQLHERLSILEESTHGPA